MTVVMTTIIFLNFIIAEASASYDKVKQNLAAMINKEQAKRLYSDAVLTMVLKSRQNGHNTVEQRKKDSLVLAKQILDPFNQARSLPSASSLYGTHSQSLDRDTLATCLFEDAQRLQALLALRSGCSVPSLHFAEPRAKLEEKLEVELGSGLNLGASQLLAPFLKEKRRECVVA